MNLMSFVCPKCPRGSVKITSSIELPPDSRSDEINVQIVTCSQCGFRGLAVYEESRRGALDSESVDHRGYYVEPAMLSSIQKLMKRCPEPRNIRCHCTAHRILNRANEFGRWNWLDDIPNTGTFRLKLMK